MSIRRATRHDVREISSLVESLAHFYLDNSKEKIPNWLSETLTVDAFLNRLTSKNFVNFVYEKNGKIIGYISLKNPNHLYHLFVSEKFQGNGISRLLWDHVKASIEEQVFTLRSSIYAIPIYKRFGFVESEKIGVRDGISFQPMKLVLKC